MDNAKRYLFSDINIPSESYSKTLYLLQEGQHKDNIKDNVKDFKSSKAVEIVY